MSLGSLVMQNQNELRSFLDQDTQGLGRAKAQLQGWGPRQRHEGLRCKDWDQGPQAPGWEQQ
jgi:hypothetical protein